ncbi:MAG: hypothetical protein LJE89_01995 [Deltaproteobacteria bacterium]|nr:hypothetical protein [Deltaproteobacteria bacterium]
MPEGLGENWSAWTLGVAIFTTGPDTEGEELAAGLLVRFTPDTQQSFLSVDVILPLMSKH